MNNKEPQKKSHTWIVVLCLILGGIVLIPIVIVVVIMAFAMIFVPKVISNIEDQYEWDDQQQITIHAQDEDGQDITIHIGGDTEEETKPEEIKEEKNNYDGIVDDTSVTDDNKLAERLLNRYIDANYGSNCKSPYADILGSDSVVKPSTLEEKITSKYIFKLFVDLKGEEAIAENATSLEDGWNSQSKLTLSKEDYIKYGKILFGKNFNASILEEGYIYCYSLKYDEEKELYNIMIPAGCGGACSPEVYFLTEPVGLKREDNNVIVYAGVVYRGWDSDKEETIYYADSDKKIVIKPNEKGEIDYSKGTIYEVKFEKNGTAYSFVSSQKKSG